MPVPRRVRARAITIARDLRKQPTQGEWLLWSALRGSRLGVKFRRQQYVGPFVVDFYAPELRLVIEVDGPHHMRQLDYDRERQGHLESLGFRFLRLTTPEVERDLPAAIDRIAKTLATLRSPTPDPFPA
ncbi:MAG: endonuclease domain-containing protein [Deltaproteobacteria bacterium]|nr:endonuclease domain-containing protein [Deltaproteobacteria bacterium]